MCNYKEHDLEGAKASIEELLIKIEEYKAEMLDYSWHNKQQ